MFAASASYATTFYLTVSGLGGEPDYEQHFAMWAKDIDKALKPAPDAKLETLVNATREQVRSALASIAAEAKPQDALVVMLIGHGSYDGYEYKINLQGPDLKRSRTGHPPRSYPRHPSARRRYDQARAAAPSRSFASRTASSSPPPKAAPRKTPPCSPVIGSMP